MPLHVQYTAAEEAVEPGIYLVRVDAIGELQNSRYEGTLRWTFTIIDNRVPQYFNKTIYGMSGSKPSPRSKIYSWLRAFGVTLDQGQTFDLETLIGRQVIANVENSTSMTNGHEVTYSNVKDLMNVAQMPQPIQSVGNYAPAPQQQVYQQPQAPVQQYPQQVQQTVPQQVPQQQYPTQPVAGQQVVYQPAPQAAMQRPQTAAPQQPMQPMPQPVAQAQQPQQQPLIPQGQIKPAEDVYNF